MKTFVKLCETGKLKEVSIRKAKPVINSRIKAKWQLMLNHICDMANIPAALIMNISHDKLSCVVANNNYKHPYKAGDSCNLERGFYCETVIGTNSYLQINNALNNEKWKDNPDIELNMISYAGLPIMWPNNEFFGTICGLDSVEINNPKLLRNLLEQYKYLIEFDLAELLLMEIDETENESFKDKTNITMIDNFNENESIIKSSFMRRISHSFITPVTTIKGLSNFGINESKDSNIVEYFTKIIRASDYLLTLFNDIQDFQSIKENELYLNCKNINLKEIIDNTHSITKQLCEEKGLKLTTEFNFQDTFIFADSARITQILVNIISNATTYTKKNGNLFYKVSITNNTEKHYLMEVKISDSGIGMSKNFQKIMYKPFAKEKNKELINNGAGLGLPIVKALIDLMNGSISCQSELQKGTTITIILPLQKTLSNNSPNQNKLINIGNYNKINLLLAEDSIINSKIISKILESKGIKVTIVNNGLEAFKEVEKNAYDIILMDLNMPIMNGYEASVKIREAGFNNTIIALSANSNKTDIEHSLQSGIDAFLSKPIDTKKLLTTISFFYNL